MSHLFSSLFRRDPIPLGSSTSCPTRLTRRKQEILSHLFSSLFRQDPIPLGSSTSCPTRLTRRKQEVLSHLFSSLFRQDPIPLGSSTSCPTRLTRQNQAACTPTGSFVSFIFLSFQTRSDSSWIEYIVSYSSDPAKTGSFVSFIFLHFQTRSDSSWIEYIVSYSSDPAKPGRVNANRALKKFQKWLLTREHLPKFDHAMAFTRCCVDRHLLLLS